MTGVPTVHWEYNKSCSYVVEAKIVTPRVKQIYIPVYFLQEQFDDNLFIPKYENSSVMPEDRCIKPCQIQLSVGVINGRLDSYSIQSVVQNTTSS